MTTNETKTIRARGAKAILAVPIAAVLLVLTATAAGAHPRFLNPPPKIEVNTDVSLTMFVEEEKGDEIHNSVISVAVPGGWTPTTCTAPTNWSCAPGEDAGVKFMRFSRNAGAPPAQQESFPFVVHVGPNPETGAFPVNQKYDDGSDEVWSGVDAPKLTSVPSGVTPSSTTTSTPPDHGRPTNPTTTTAPGPGNATTTAIPGGATTTIAGATTTAPGETTTTTTPGGTTPGSAVGGGKGSVPTGRNNGTTVGSAPAGSTENAAGTSASSSGSAAPLIAGLVVVILAAVGGGLLIRSRANQPEAATADGPTVEGTTDAAQGGDDLGGPTDAK